MSALAALGCTTDEVKRRAAVPEAGTLHDSGDEPAQPLPEGGGRFQDAAQPADAASADVALDASPVSTDLPDLLSETGLYRDMGSETLGDGVRAFAPRFALWSDGATKRRWFYLPDGAVIDATDPDAWIFPVGTKAWKEFTRDGVRVETRLIAKTEVGWQAVAYVWNADETDAVRTPGGLSDARGTEHDVPQESDCLACHEGSPDMLLGLSAVQLGTFAEVDGGALPDLTLGTLASEGLLQPTPSSTELALPGSNLDQAALGRLHVDCGHCHRPGTFAWERAEMDLHLDPSELASLGDTAVFRTAVGFPSARSIPGTTGRIVPGLPGQSAVYVRMTSRDSVLGMPTVGTELVDVAGSSVIRSWIRSLAPDAGDGGSLDAGTDAADGAP